MKELYKTPWADFMGEVPMHLDYFQGMMIEKIEETAELYPNVTALNFMHSKVTYKELVENIHITAVAMQQLGLKEGDHVVIAMPNCPQGIYAFYAVNLIGGIAHMIHPLSAEKEVLFYIQDSKCKMLLTINAFYKKFLPAVTEGKVKYFLLANLMDVLNPVMKVGFQITTGRKIPKVPKDGTAIFWKHFIKYADGKDLVRVHKDKDDTAVVLYSGGTTGTPKGIALTNYNFNALAAQILATNPMARVADTMLAAMPLFHGFGLGVCIHSILACGGTCILVPRFTADSYSKLVVKYHCNFIAGVPTLYEALTRTKVMNKADLSCLKGVFSGGDSLSIELKKKFDKFLKEHNASIQIREGYGTTECVTASCLTPLTQAKEGSIGIPFPDTYYRVVKPGTEEELPYGEEGEIILAGPTVMKEYTNHPQETADTLHTDEHGTVWLHTGDLGVMDEEGFIYFRGRIKRLIVTSGYNVYPAQVENIIEQHDAVQMSCVIGIPDPYRMHRVKAYVVLKPGKIPSEILKNSILNHCKKYIAKYAMPREIEFREDLPKTLVGKVAYRQLEEEVLNSMKQNEQKQG